MDVGEQRRPYEMKNAWYMQCKKALSSANAHTHTNWGKQCQIILVFSQWERNLIRAQFCLYKV